MEERIAIHVLYDFCLPLQKGAPGSEERTKSNKEIAEVLQEHKCDHSDLLYDGGYYIPKRWLEKDGKIRFENSNGDWETVPKDWVIFERNAPVFFDGMDK